MPLQAPELKDNSLQSGGVTINKSVFGDVRTLTTYHCPHSPAARRRCSNRSIAPACLGPQQRTCSSAFAAVGPCWDRQTDGRTPYRCVDPAAHAMQAVPASISCGRWTRATRCFMLYTELDALCDKLANVDPRKYCQLSQTDNCRQFITPSVHFSRTELIARGLF